MRRQASEHRIEAVGETLRGMMPWIGPIVWSISPKTDFSIESSTITGQIILMVLDLATIVG